MEMKLDDIPCKIQVTMRSSPLKVHTPPLYTGQSANSRRPLLTYRPRVTSPRFYTPLSYILASVSCRGSLHQISNLRC
eukprot:331417-Hanusia_phi.AAC.1